MRLPKSLALAGGLTAAVAAIAAAQRPGDLREGPSASPSEFAARMLGFDKDGDGKLTLAEVPDARLHRLFARADADHDGTVTRAELEALAIKETAGDRGGPPGPGGPTGLPWPGEVLPGRVRDQLKVSPAQAEKLDALQEHVDEALKEILDDEQEAQLRHLRERSPDGPPRGGRRPGGEGPPPGPPR